MPEENNKNKKKHREKSDLSLAEYRLVPVEEFENDIEDENSLDLTTLFQLLLDNRKTIYKIVSASFIIGILIAVLSPIEYQTRATLMPELSNEAAASGAAGLLQKYGGLLGLNSTSLTGNNPSMINVTLYPDIIRSTPFMLKLMSIKVHSTKYDTTVTIYHYFNDVYKPSIFSYIRKYTLGLPELIKGLFVKNKVQSLLNNSQKGLIQITKKQESVVNSLRARLSASVDNQTGIITISSKMPEAQMSAVVAKNMIQLLKNYVIQYRTQKAMQNYLFIKGQYEKAKKRFQDSQDTLAKYQDENSNLATAQAQTHLKRLQDEYSLAYNLYNSLAQEKEQARIQVQQNTPIFKILEPATIPIKKSSPKRKMIVMLSIFLGLFFGTAVVLLTKDVNK